MVQSIYWLTHRALPNWWSPGQPNNLPYNYEFTGNFEIISEPKIYEFTVRYHDDSGTVLETRTIRAPYHDQQHPYIPTPTNVTALIAGAFQGSTPTRTPTLHHTFNFVSWSRSAEQWFGAPLIYQLDEQTVNVYPYFDLQVRYFTITFVNYNGVVMDTQTSIYVTTIPNSQEFFDGLFTGVTPHRSSTATHSFTFNGWRNAAGQEVTAIASDIRLYAQFTQSNGSNNNGNNINTLIIGVAAGAVVTSILMTIIIVMVARKKRV